MNPVLERGATFLWNNARPLERAVFAFQFTGAPAQRILDILATYQNEDGGFGHALEPDARAPGSQVLFVEHGLHLLHDCGLHAPKLAAGLCDFVARQADLQRGIPTLTASAFDYPRAPHWVLERASQPSMDRLVGLVGLLRWQGLQNAWLEQAVPACLAYLQASVLDDAHTIKTAFTLLESLAGGPEIASLYARLAQDLLAAAYLNLDPAAATYGLTPLEFAPTPDAFCRPIFSDEVIAAHLDHLQSQQQADGGWPISWQPPSEMARCEWRGERTVKALWTLHAYGRI